MEYRFLWFVSTCNNDFEANRTSLMSLWANIKFFPEPTSELYCWLLATLVTSRPFLKTAGGIVLGSVAVSAVSADVLPYISVAIKASFLKLGMCNICKNNIAKMFLDF